MSISTKGLRYNLTLRYIVALLLVGALVLIGHFVSRATTTRISDHMRLVRVAEKEALITEQLAKTLRSMQVVQNSQQLRSMKQQIESSVQRLSKVHGYFKEETSEIFLEDHLREYLDAVEAQFLTFRASFEKFSAEALGPGARNPENFRYANSLDELIGASTGMSKALLNLADASEQNNMARMQSFERLNNLITLLILFLLVIEAFYVFRPAVNKMNDALAARSEFLGRVSHEIRNPMNAIIGMSSILKETKLSQQQRKYLKNLDSAAETLLGMLNNLLDFRALEKEKVVLEEVPFDLVDMAEGCVDLASTSAYAKNIEVTLVMDRAMPYQLIGDGYRLQQVIINLLGNAVKFTEEGYVALQIEKVVEHDTSVDLRFLIKDTGIGIEAEKLQNVFESFYQEDPSIRKKYGGSGLGLTIVHDLVQLMDGRIDVKSQKGEGSLFIIDLSFEKAEAHSDRRTSDLAGRALNFISDDGQKWRYASLEVAGASVNSYTYPPPIASLSDEVCVLDDSTDPDTIIKTAKSAIEAGHQCIASLRTSFPHEKIEALKQVGVEDFLFKPLKAWEFERLINGEVKALQQPETKAPTPQKLMVVDDSEDNLVIMERLLAGMDWQADSFLNGEKAFLELQNKSYQAVLVDIEMPGWDGYRFLSELRRWEHEQNKKEPTRVIAVTGHSPLDGEAYDFSDFDGYIQKPISRSKIKETLERLSRTEPQV